MKLVKFAYFTEKLSMRIPQWCLNRRHTQNISVGSFSSGEVSTGTKLLRADPY